MKKILFLIIALMVSISVSGCFGGLSGPKEDKDISKYENKAENIINVLNKNHEIAEKGANKQEKQVNTRDGYSLFSSLLSHSGDMVVYTEVKGRLEDLYSGWEYHIKYKDLKTGENRTIYSFPESASWQTSFNGLLAKPVLAQGCQGIPFPIAWTKNDKKVILEGIDPVGCGSGGGSGFGHYIADPHMGALEPLRYLAYFDEYSKALILEDGDKILCNSMNVPVNEKAVAYDLEYDRETDMAAEDGYHYRFLGIDKKMNILDLEKVKVYNNKNKGCYEFVSKGEKVEVRLDEFSD